MSYEIKYYKGSLTVHKDRVRIQCKEMKDLQLTTYISSSFNLTKYSLEEAIEEAEKHWVSESDRLGLTEIQKVKVLTREQKEYIAGFFDGDGSITFTKEGKLVLQVAQSSCDDNPPPSLVQLKEAFDGHVNGPYSREVVGVYGLYKPEYQFGLYGKHAKPFLEIIKDCGIIKLPQAEKALECITKSTTHRLTAQLRLKKKHKKIYYDFFKKAKDEYSSVAIDPARLTDAWIAGFFDAEGCITWVDDRTPQITFTQHGCKKILHAINSVFDDTGCVSTGRLMFNGYSALPVLDRIISYLVEKRSQVEPIYDYLKTRVKGKRKTDEELQEEERN